MRVLGSYAFMQLCSLAGQSGHSVSAGEKCNRLGAHLLTACHTVHLNPPPHPPTPLARSGCLSVPFRLLAGAFPAACRCASCLPIQLLAVFRLLACPPPPPRLLNGRLLSSSGCLPGRPAACRAPATARLPSRLLVGFKGRFPSLRAACPPRGSPFSTCSLFVSTCQLVVFRASSCLFRCLFVVNCQPARRACSPAIPDEFVSRSSSPVV